MILLCGRYEAVDERLIEHEVDEEISIGDYVLSGGEVAAAVLIDASGRLQGGALNGSQQQFYVRNTDLGAGWSNGVWNQVFSGDLNAPAQDFGVGPNQYTTLPANTARGSPFVFATT